MAVREFGVHVLELGMRNGSVLAERVLGYRMREFLFFGFLFSYSSNVENRETEGLLSKLGITKFEK